ncbi:separase [Sarracenia purpurea var. burkii]
MHCSPVRRDWRFRVHVTEPPNEPTLRSLSKTFLPVLNRALSIIDKRLTETSNLDEQESNAFEQESNAFEQESNAFDDNEKMIVNVAVAALTLAFRTKLYVMENANLIEQLIFVDLIKANGLKCLSQSLRKVGDTLYENNQVKEVLLHVNYGFEVICNNCLFDDHNV